MNYISFYGSHDSSICINVNGTYRIYELERLTQKRYYRFDDKPNFKLLLDQIKDLIVKEFGYITFDKCYYLHLNDNHQAYLNRLFQIKEFEIVGHHLSHAACSFYQSPFSEALVISFDGGGFDNGPTDDERVSFFNIYHASRSDGIKRIAKLPLDLGTSYGLIGIPISEIKKPSGDWGKDFLAFPGKLMGLVAYGQVQPKWLESLKNFYKSYKRIATQDLDLLGQEIGLGLSLDNLSGQMSFDLAASSQKAFEDVVLEALEPFLRDNQLPVCLSGGCALNVILNQKLKDSLSVPIFIPPNPSDCGLAFGMMALKLQPQEPMNITYSGIPILDLDRLSSYNGQDCSIEELAQILRQGKIVGIINGNSEIGPRALGNRSIICDPSFPNMKQILNDKVKFREGFRPFAPMVRADKVSEYFNFSGDAAYMSFSPETKDEWRNKIPAIVHQDGTARVQTVTQEQNSFIFNLLTEFEKISGFGVILNTSFNIKGKPILTSIADALEVLKTTELDLVYCEGKLFRK